MLPKNYDKTLAVEVLFPAKTSQNFSLVLLQCLLLALYLILLSVLYLTQFGMGRFCLIFFANLTFFLKVLIEPYTKESTSKIPYHLFFYYVI
jgi:hypothetical protein